MCILCQGVYVCIFMCVFLSVRVYMKLFVSIECAHDTVAVYMYLWIRHRYITCNAGLCLREQEDLPLSPSAPLLPQKIYIIESKKRSALKKNSLIAFVFLACKVIFLFIFGV